MQSHRSELQKLFDAHRSRFVDTVHNEILKPALAELREANFTGITLIVDGLGDIPLRSIDDELLAANTNHEQIFIEQGDELKGLGCDWSTHFRSSWPTTACGSGTKRAARRRSWV